MTTRLTEYRPPRIAMVLLAGAAIVSWLAPFVAMHVFASAAVAIAFCLTGFMTMMWAWWQFQQRHVAVCPTEATELLITSGIYRLTRNPMYLGLIMMLIGIALFFGTLPFYLVVIAYSLIIDRAFCRYEEDKLLATFGLEYEKYRSSVRRWL